MAQYSVTITYEELVKLWQGRVQSDLQDDRYWLIPSSLRGWMRDINGGELPEQMTGYRVVWNNEGSHNSILLMGRDKASVPTLGEFNTLFGRPIELTNTQLVPGTASIKFGIYRYIDDNDLG